MARRWLLAVAAAAVALAACGTRLPDSSFQQQTVPSAPTTTAPVNGATDVGVTADTITIGTIASKSNPFDARVFVGPSYGLQAFVDDINARGGINGRKLVLKSCDDVGSAQQNVTCVHQLIDKDKVFALVSTSILNYAGAGIADKAGVPDIGGQPIDVAYTRYPHLWDITGEIYPRDGTAVGYDGVLVNGTEVYRYFKVTYPDVPLRAGVVSYNQAASQRYADAIAKGLRREGYQVTETQVNFALPDYDSVVIRMREDGVRYVFDAMDRVGSERLCEAIDANRLPLVAKVTTTQNWNADVRTDYKDSPFCRNHLFATGQSRSYDATDSAAVQRFRTAMQKMGWGGDATMSQWALEGWAGAQWFADAAASCGRDLTRDCVEEFMGRAAPYGADGLLVPRNFVVDENPGSHRQCINVARWQDSSHGGNGGWVEQVPDMTENCFVVPYVEYSP